MIRTKIVATLGPASGSPEMIDRLIEAGVDVFRLNFSHGTLDGHAETYARVRETAKKRDATVATMVDLCGPKVRVDEVQDGGVPVSPGDSIDIVREHVVGDARRISTNRPQLVDELRPGHRVLIDDGAIRLRVAEAAGDRARCECEVGGIIRDRKGVNLPDSSLVVSALTDADREGARWAREHEVEYIALSFVRSAADIRELRQLFPAEEPRPHAVAKIETAHALDDLDAIVSQADAVLVARGDLGVEVDLARVPLIQKDLTRRCQSAGKPVIIATQMLQSMVDSPTATRAEVSDVANAVLDGADAVMLSAETSVGRFPLHAVRLMNHIAKEAESVFRRDPGLLESARGTTRSAETPAVVRAADLLAREVGAKLVAVWTQSGNSVRLLSKFRLACPIVAMSPQEAVCRRMALYYGAVPVRRTPAGDVGRMLADIDELVTAKELAVAGDRIVVMAGSNLSHVGFSNSVLIHEVGSA